MHPLVASAWDHLRPRLPQPWRFLFGPQTVDINDVADEARRWLVETGMWSRRRTLFGWRYRSTGAAPSPTPPFPPGSPGRRRTLLQSLVSTAQLGTATTGDAVTPELVSADTTEQALQAVLQTTTELIAWKAANPALPRAGM